MKLRIEIELDNAPFRDQDGELPRILACLAERVPDPPQRTNGDLSLHDANGDWVGYARIIGGKIKRD